MSKTWTQLRRVIARLRRLTRRLGAGQGPLSPVERDRLRLLEDVIQAMDPGLMVLSPDLAVEILTPRTVALVGLPREYLSDPPPYPDILAHQVAAGRLSAQVRDRVLQTLENMSHGIDKDVFERSTANGHCLDVRTTRRRDGGFIRTYIDRTERQKADDELREAHANYRNLFQNAEIGLFRTTVDGRQTRANPALVRLNGYDSEEEMLAAVGDIAQEWYVEPGRREAFKAAVERDGKVTDFCSEVYRHKTRERIWVSETAWALRDVRGHIIGYEGSIVEASDRMAAEAEMLHMARHDELTGLVNRRRLNELLVEACAGEAAFALITLDLDGFKAVNDDFGHPAGDMLLRAIAGRLRAAVGGADVVARIGGDEFAIIAHGADRTAAQAMVARLVEVAARPVGLDAATVNVGASVGAAVFPEDAREAEELLSLADAALYEIKHRHRSPSRLLREAQGAPPPSQPRISSRSPALIEPPPEGLPN